MRMMMRRGQPKTAHTQLSLNPVLEEISEKMRQSTDNETTAESNARGINRG